MNKADANVRVHVFSWIISPWRGLRGPGTDTPSFKEMNEVGLPPPGEEDGRAANLQADKDALAPLQVLGALPSAPSPRVSPCPRYYGNA